MVTMGVTIALVTTRAGKQNAPVSKGTRLQKKFGNGVKGREIQIEIKQQLRRNNIIEVKVEDRPVRGIVDKVSFDETNLRYNVAWHIQGETRPRTLHTESSFFIRRETFMFQVAQTGDEVMVLEFNEDGNTEVGERMYKVNDGSDPANMSLESLDLEYADPKYVDRNECKVFDVRREKHEKLST